MDRSALIEVLKKYATPLRQNGATGLYLFGSRARGTHRPDSDLDLFVDYDPDVRVPKLLRLIRLEREISAELGIPVTITTRYALHPLMKDRIERDAIRVL